MDNPLLFPSQEIFEGATFGDCIRQSLIAIGFNDIDADEAQSVFKSGLDFLGAPEFSPQDERNLHSLLLAIYKGFESTEQLFLDFVTAHMANANISLVVFACSMAETCASRYGRTLNLPKDFFSHAVTSLLQGQPTHETVSTLLIVLQYVDVTEEQAKSVISMCLERNLGWSGGNTVDLTEYLIRLNMTHLMPKEIPFSVSFAGRKTDNDFILTLKALSPRVLSSDAVTISENLVQDGVISRPKCQAFLERCAENGISLPSECIQRMLQVLSPDDLTDGIWEYLRNFAFVLPDSFASQIRDWNVPNYLLLTTKKLPMGMAEKRELMKQCLTTPGNYSRFLRVSQDEEILSSAEFWIGFLQNGVSAGTDLSQVGGVLAQNVHEDVIMALALQILRDCGCGKTVCELLKGANVHVTDKELARCLLDVLMEVGTEGMSQEFWLLIPEPAVLIELSNDPKFASKQYLLRHAALYLYFARDIRKDNTVFANFTVLPQTPESLKEILQLCSAPRESSDIFCFSKALSEQTRSLLCVLELYSHHRDSVTRQALSDPAIQLPAIDIVLCHWHTRSSAASVLENPFWNVSALIQYVTQAFLEGNTLVEELTGLFFSSFTEVAARFDECLDLGHELLAVVIARREGKPPAYLRHIMTLFSDITHDIANSREHGSDSGLAEQLARTFLESQSGDVLEFIFAWSVAVLGMDIEKIDLSILDPAVVTNFFESGHAELSTKFIAFVTKVCRNFPEFRVEDKDKFLSLLRLHLSPDLVEDNKEAMIQCMFSFMKYMKWTDLATDLFSQVQVADHLKGVVDLMLLRYGITDQRSLDAVFDTITGMADSKCPLRALYALVESVLLDFDTRVTQIRRLLESRDEFALKVGTLASWSASVYQAHPQEWCTAVMENYDIPPTAEFMLMQRARKYPIRPTSELNKQLVIRLWESVKANPSAKFYLCLKNIADVAPTIFLDVREQIPFLEIFEVVLEEAAKLDQCESMGNTMSIEQAQMYQQAFLAIALVKFLLCLPQFLDAIVPYILENVWEKSPGQKVFCFSIIATLFNTPTVQLITAALMLKHKWIDRFIEVLGAPTEAKSCANTMLSDLTSAFWGILDTRKGKVPVIVDELQTMANPYTACFDDRITVGDARGSTDFSAQFLSFVGPALSWYLGVVCESLSAEMSRASVDEDAIAAQLVEARQTLISTRPDPSAGDLSGLPATVDKEAYAHLPAHLRANVLYFFALSIPNEITPIMQRILLHAPAWVGDFIRTRPSLMLLEEHYLVLLPVLQQLNDLTGTQESGIHVSMPVNPSLIATLVKQLFSRDEKVSQLSQSFLCWIGGDRQSLDAILDALAKTDFSAPRNPYPIILKLLSLLKHQDYFLASFKAHLSNVLLNSVILGPANTDNIVQIVKFYFDTVDPVPGQVVQLLTYLLLSTEASRKDVIELCVRVPEQFSEMLLHYIEILFQRLLDAFSPGTNAGRVCFIIENWPQIAQGRRDSLMKILDSLLSNFDSDNLHIIGILCSALCPPRTDSTSASVGDSVSASPMVASSAASEVRSLFIPARLVDQAPDFWQLMERHLEVLTNVINSKADRALRHLKFLMNYPEVLPLEPKVQIFRSMQRRRMGNSVQLRVRRPFILEDSFRRLRSIGYKNLASEISVKFQGEPAIDMGGVRRDWFSSVITEIFNPNYALFIPSSNERSYQPNPSSYVNPQALDYFEFAGAVLASAIANGISVPAHLTRGFLKHILGQRLRLSDVEDVDEGLHQSLVWMLENDIEGVDMTFTADYEHLGKHEVIELVEGGSEIELTNANKEEFVRLMTEYRLKTQIREQIDAFCRGFYAVLPHEAIKIFKPDEFSLVICGVPEIDIDDMQANMSYSGRYDASSPTVQYFFNVIRGFDKEQRAKLLLFMTGSSQVPLGGFAALRETGRPLVISRGPGPEYLPTAHTCTNELVLPPYRSEAELKTKLLMAINECNSFGFA